MFLLNVKSCSGKLTTYVDVGLNCHHVYPMDPKYWFRI